MTFQLLTTSEGKKMGKTQKERFGSTRKRRRLMSFISIGEIRRTRRGKVHETSYVSTA